LQTEEDIDLYLFHAQAGERIQFNLLAARNGISTDASLAILRPDGSQVVHDDGSLVWDPYIDHTFVDEGDFLAAVTLTRMPAGGQTRTDLNYQLGIGRSPFFRSIFPLGGLPGSAIKGILRADFVTSGTPLVVQRVGMPGSQVAMVSGQIGKRVDSE